MAKRLIDTELWNNEDIVEHFTAEDKYFWLYLLTSPHNNICGVFRNSPALMARDMGLHKETIVNLLYRFETIHKLISADKDTNEVLILNWYKFNWNKSPKLRILIDSELAKIASESIVKLVADRIKKVFDGDTLSIPYTYPTNTNSISNTTSYNNGGDKLNNKTQQKRARACVRVNEFEQAIECDGWEKYPNGEVYAELRDTLIGLINDGSIELSDITHDDLGTLLDSMWKGRERRKITNLAAYCLAAIKKEKA